MIKLLSPKNGTCVSALSAEHVKFFNAQPYAVLDKTKWREPCRDDEDKSLPCPIIFCFEPKINGVVVLTDSQGNTVEYPANNGVAHVYNLFTGSKYSWHVRVGCMNSESAFFFTEGNVPRILWVEGLSNVRDIGGYESSLGGRVRQGKVFRSTEFDRSYTITQTGLKTLINEFGIRTDFDLRGVSEKSVTADLGEDNVRWINFPVASYSDIFTEEQKKLYRESFEFLANKDAYPIIVHCQAGMDRTGTWIYVLGTLLGIDENVLMSDYEFSSFSVWGPRSRHSTTFKTFVKKLNSYGNTPQLAAEGFLLDCGVSIETLQRIRNILIEK